MDQQLPPARSRQYARQIDTLGVSATVRGSAADAWQFLPSVFTELGLQINFRDPAGKRLGACYQVVHTRLGRELLSTILDCGETRSIPNADSYQVALTVLTTIGAEEGGSVTVSTFVLGVGKTDSAGSGGRVWCYSKADLEERIRARLAEKLNN